MLLADLKILAIDALEVAAAEEDIPRTLLAGYGRLFTEMRPVMGDDDLFADPAIPFPVPGPARLTPPRAKLTLHKMGKSILHIDIIQK
jgi:hypothetical protein